MKTLAIAACLTLAACQIAPGFDSVSFDSLVQASAASVDLKVNCSILTAKQVHDQIVFPVLVANQASSAMPHAQDFAKATGSLLDMAQGLAGFYGPGKTPSEAFCEAQLGQLHDGAQRILQGYGGAK